MGIPYQRGMLLYHQKRYAMAAEEFREELSQVPGSALAMSMLAMSLVHGGHKQAEALPVARAAIAADPERGFCHYALACTIIGSTTRWTNGKILLGGLIRYRWRLRRAKPAAMEAVRLEPRNPDNLALMSGIELDLKSPRKALEWADKGLAAQATHVRCANFRAKALAKLGRIADARQTLRGALAVDPENAMTHATSGWTHLKDGETRTAVTHFTESLRLNPMDENTKRGLSLAKAGKKVVPPVVYAGLGITILHLVNPPIGDGPWVYGVALIIAILAIVVLVRKALRK